MKLTPKQKYEIKSFIQTFLAVFIPLVIVTIDTIDISNLSKETLTALAVAIMRASIKALWTVVSTKLVKDENTTND